MLARYDPPAPSSIDEVLEIDGEARTRGRRGDTERSALEQPGLPVHDPRRSCSSIGPLIFIHELGHYFVGRWFGVKADTFSIGFGRELFGWTDKRGTRWKVGWLPLGGYVKFAGDMNPASHAHRRMAVAAGRGAREDLPGEEGVAAFPDRAAGPATNFLFAIIAFMIIFATYGYPSSTGRRSARSSRAASRRRRASSPATRSSRSTASRIETFADLRPISRCGRTSRWTFACGAAAARCNSTQRRARSLRPTVSAIRPGLAGSEFALGPAGIQPAAAWQLPGAGLSKTVDSVQTMLTALGQVISGRRALSELGGPLKIAQVSGQQASLGWLSFFWFMTIVSINLGFINLLPIPLLDGGHLLFYAIEGVRRKPLRPAAQEWAFRTGLAVLLALMIFVTFNDLASFGLFEKLGGLIG